MPIVKQPIHNARGEVWAHEILYSADAERPTDAEAAAALQSILLQHSESADEENKITFVTFTEHLLARGVPRIFKPEALVIQIDHDALLSPEMMDMIRTYREEGYKIALVDFDFNAMYLSALNIIDYVKLNFKSPSVNHVGAIEVLKGFQKEIIAYHVDSRAAHERATKAGLSQMQGLHIASILPATVRSINLIPANFFRLIVAITRENPSFDEIEEIVSRDVTLSYSLLRLVNSAYFALRTRVTSVHQGLVIVGLDQLKQWVYLLSFNPDGKAPMEFMRTSLMRAQFCESLAEIATDIPISKSEAYLMGLFSTLGALLQVPLADALAELNLSDDVRKALLEGEGRCGLLYKLVLSYEKADWHMIAEFGDALGISGNAISQTYFECMDRVNEIWKKIIQTM